MTVAVGTIAQTLSMLSATTCLAPSNEVTAFSRTMLPLLLCVDEICIKHTGIKVLKVSPRRHEFAVGPGSFLVFLCSQSSHTRGVGFNKVHQTKALEKVLQIREVRTRAVPQMWCNQHADKTLKAVIIIATMRTQDARVQSPSREGNANEYLPRRYHLRHLENVLFVSAGRRLNTRALRLYPGLGLGVTLSLSVNRVEVRAD